MSTTKELLNRDLSWLSFNRRVLDEAFRQRNRLQERTNFIAISGSNLAEFTRVRYPSAITDNEGDIDELKKAIVEHYNDISISWERFNLQKGLVKPWNKLSKFEQCWLNTHFTNSIYPALVPVTVDEARKPSIHSGIYMLVSTYDGKKNTIHYIEIPSGLPRFIQVNEKPYCVSIETLIRANMKQLIKGQKVEWAYPFSILRSAEIYVQSDIWSDPYTLIQETLKEREKSWVTRIEIGSKQHNADDIIRGMVPVNENTMIVHANTIQLSDVRKIPSGVYESGQLARTFTPVNTISTKQSMFDYIKAKNRLLFHPYESYDGSFVRFLEEAAEDENVLSIRICLYRVSNRSRIIDALLKAADTGKLVTVLVELKARFDEKHNIEISNILREGGVRIVYTKPNIKTHAKVCLVTRKENEDVVVYSHVGTGNYSEANARLYTDYSYFTADKLIGNDLVRFFNLLTSDQDNFKSNVITYAPYDLKDTIVDHIENEMKYAKKGKKARIIAKCNALTDPGVANKLIEAAKVGVKITLIVRSACVIKPQKNIRIYSIVGRFLEHSRIYVFGNGKHDTVYLGSADLMVRSMNRRNELLVNITDKALKNRLLRHISWYIHDDMNRREIVGDYNYYNVYGRYDETVKQNKKILDCQSAAIEEAKHMKF